LDDARADPLARWEEGKLILDVAVSSFVTSVCACI
jgi:hypothetical protein